MKKTMLSSSMLAILLASASSNAAFVDASGGSFDGNINFGGTIVDVSPIWSFQIPSPTVEAIKGWHSIAQIQGLRNGDNTEFHFTDKPVMTMIQGFMKTSAASGGPGLTPEIKVGQGENELTLDGTKQPFSVTATGQSGAGSTEGKLSFDVQGYIGGAYIDDSTPKYFGSKMAQNVLTSNRQDIATAYQGIVAAETDFAAANAIFANVDSKTLSGAYTVDMRNYKLAFPTNNMPETWTAAVPVTVILK